MGAYPLESDAFNKMADSIEKLALNDRGLSIQRESSTALGQGISSSFGPNIRVPDGIPGISTCRDYRGSSSSRIWVRCIDQLNQTDSCRLSLPHQPCHTKLFIEMARPRLSPIQQSFRTQQSTTPKVQHYWSQWLTQR